MSTSQNPPPPSPDTDTIANAIEQAATNVSLSLAHHKFISYTETKDAKTLSFLSAPNRHPSSPDIG